MHRCLLVITAVCMMTLMTDAQDKTESTDDIDAIVKKDPVGYFLGVSMGQQLSSQGLKVTDFELQAVYAGIRDALSNQEIRVSEKDLPGIRDQFQSLIEKRVKEMMEKKKQAGDAWLKENLEKDGIKELVGGMQYKVLAAGDGGSPSPSDTVKVHYTGTLTNGKVFDSSVQRGEPAQFVVGQVIKGWQMALQKMKVGDKWMLYIPAELAYKDRGSPPVIGPNEVLVFEVELLDIL